MDPQKSILKDTDKEENEFPKNLSVIEESISKKGEKDADLFEGVDLLLLSAIKVYSVIHILSYF